MERSGSTFAKHTRNRHFLWNYLYYLYCLRLKSPTDFTGLEYEIDKKVNEEDVEWFPALGEGDTGGETEKVIADLESEIKNVFDNLSKTVDIGSTTLKDARSAVEKIKGR